MGRKKERWVDQEKELVKEYIKIGENPEYPKKNDPTKKWVWAFLRRSPDYIKQYLKVSKSYTIDSSANSAKKSDKFINKSLLNIYNLGSFNTELTDFNPANNCPTDLQLREGFRCKAHGTVSVKPLLRQNKKFNHRYSFGITYEGGAIKVPTDKILFTIDPYLNKETQLKVFKDFLDYIDDQKTKKSLYVKLFEDKDFLKSSLELFDAIHEDVPNEIKINKIIKKDVYDNQNKSISRRKERFIEISSNPKKTFRRIKVQLVTHSTTA